MRLSMLRTGLLALGIAMVANRATGHYGTWATVVGMASIGVYVALGDLRS